MSENQNYLVLARKYRPKNFSELIGQEALVQTLTNAIKVNRVAHAFILTGIRGIGKTTTARIIAKSLNCIGEDGKGGMTAAPCGVCEQCVSIAEDRNVDVIETDAASRTGVNDIREIIDNVQYIPVSGRYKIYIIDEVHMLSKSAFNALLKTLEEPPPHVKFIFATTEIRKIPLTILSRCQRFDLARVEVDQLTQRFIEIAKLEGYEIEPEAAAIIARGAQGSVRDGLSILDRALSSAAPGEQIKLNHVQTLLGISETAEIYELFAQIAEGDIKAALQNMQKIYNAGFDVLNLCEDLLELIHFISQLKIDEKAAQNSYFANTNIDKAKTLASKLSMPFLVRSWQILLKGIDEIKAAPNAVTAAEMVLIKLTYSSNLPLPADLIKKPETSEQTTDLKQQSAYTSTKPETASALLNNLEQKPERNIGQQSLSQSSSPQTSSQPLSSLQLSAPQNFDEIATLFKQRQEHFIHSWLINDVHLISFEEGRLEIRLSETAPKDLPGKVSKKLQEWTGKRWVIIISNNKGAKTIKERQEEELEKKKKAAVNDKLVQEVLRTFQGFKIKEIRELSVAEQQETGITKNKFLVSN